MSVFSALFGSDNEAGDEQVVGNGILNVDNQNQGNNNLNRVDENKEQNNGNINDENNNPIIENVENKDEEKKNEEKKEEEEQALYKIVQEIAVIGMREENFSTLKLAVAHWESLSYLCAAIWYQWDTTRNEWHIKDSYGTTKATQRICDYVDSKYHQRKIENEQKNMLNEQGLKKQNSLIAYLTSFVSSDAEAQSQNEDNDDDNKQNDNDNTENKESNDNENDKTDAQKTALLDDFFKWTEFYAKNSGIKPVSNLDNDNRNCQDLIVSLVWSVGFQCYYLSSYDLAQQTWKSLGSWYSSVWFTRNATGTFVVHDNFGTADSMRRICRFVNDAQETWNYMERKKKIYQKTRPLNDNKDSVIIGKTKRNLNNNNDNDDDYKNGTEITHNKSNSSEDYSKLCIVCLDGVRDHILIPCGHICVCKNCMSLYNRPGATCPMCRQNVENVIKTFT